MNNLIRGAYNQLRVVHALTLRETRTRFGAHRLGYLWAVLEPIFWIGTFWGFFYVANRSSPHGLAVVPFLATGIITYELVVKTADRCSLAISGNKALLFYPHVHTLDLILARSALEVATYVSVFLLIVGSVALVDSTFVIEDVLRMMQGMGLAGLLGASLGLVLCSLSVLNNSVDRIKGPVMRPLFWISGLFFTAEALPTRIRELLMWNPILHCVELVRDGFFPSYHERHASTAYVLVWIIALSFIGLTLERSVRAKVELT